MRDAFQHGILMGIYDSDRYEVRIVKDGAFYWAKVTEFAPTGENLEPQVHKFRLYTRALDLAQKLTRGEGA